MEFILELIFEIIVEGSFELGTSKKVPWFLRILALLVFVAIYGGLVGIFALIALNCWRDGNLVAALLVLALDAAFVVLLVHMIRKKIRENSDI